MVGGSTGAGKSTLVNSLVGRRVTDARRAPSDHPLAGAGAPPRRRPLVRAGPAAAGPGAGRRPRPTDPGCPAAGPRGQRAAGPGDPGRARHRLGRGAQPHARRPAARRRRPVAVRHLGGPVRRPGAVGLPAQGRRAQRRGGHRARPHSRRGGRDGVHAPGPDAGQPGAEGLAAVHRPGGSGQRRGSAPRHRRQRHPRLAGGAGRRRRTHAPPWSARPWTGPSAPWPAPPTWWPTPRPSRPRPGVGSARTPTRPTPWRSKAVSTASADGTLLRGEVLARWQEFVGTGELLRSLETRIGCLARPDRELRQGPAAAGRAGHRGRRVGPGDPDPRARRGRRRAGRGVLAVPGLGPGAARRCRRGPRPGLPRLPPPHGAGGARLAAGRARAGAQRGRGQAHHGPFHGVRRQRALGRR